MSTRVLSIIYIILAFSNDRIDMFLYGGGLCSFFGMKDNIVTSNKIN